MKKLNYTELNEVIKSIKTNKALKINVFRAIKEFLLKHKDEIYKYDKFLFIGDKWIYNPETPKNIQPILKPLFCGFCDTNDDTYHYWLRAKKVLKKYGITYNDYKAFNSVNYFITGDNRLYINDRYYEVTAQ